MGDEADWLVGDGPIVQLIRAKDWSQTPLGPMASWPESLRTTVSLTLASSFPINLIWGDGCVQIWNEAYSVICGDKHPTEFGSDFRVCWKSAWPAIGSPFEQARAGRPAFLENVRMYLDRKGFLEETWFTFSLGPIRDEHGQVAGLFHPATETTDRMLSARRTQTLRDLSDAATGASSTDEAITAMGAVIARSLADLPFSRLYLVDAEGRTATLRGQTNDNREHPEPPVLIALADGSPIASAIRDLTTVRLDEPGARSAMVMPIATPGATRADAAVVLGISDRVAFDEGYQSFLDLVAQTATSALTSARAREQERERLAALAELDRAKSAFFADVSHEFRTPLTLMLGPLEEELASDEGSPERRERLEMVHRNSLRLLRLVNSLLDFSRTDDARTEAAFVPTDLARFTADLAELFRYAVEGAGVGFTVDCQPVSHAVAVDRDMWERIVLNLLSNAFKHTFHGEITVALREHDGAVSLSVSDTGVGIPEADLAVLFERFHRVKGARSRSIEGSGIGLAVVAQLARRHGGDVTVASEEGHGSTFTVTIPLTPADLTPPELTTAASVATPSGAAAAEAAEALRWLPVEPQHDGSLDDRAVEGSARILLVDDNADMRRYVAGLLEPQYAVLTASDGIEALTTAIHELPDLVISDVMMPRLDGFGLLTALREDARTSTIPVIMLSARAGEQAAVEGIRAGVDDYLAKPFAAQELLIRVARSLELARVRRENEQRLAAVNAELSDALEQVTQLARTDPGTGLPNRRTWDEELRSALARAELHHYSLCVALLDLDHLKTFNDRHGHQAGDQLLAETSAAWRDSLLPSDLIARIGGDEFAILLPGHDLDQAKAAIERVCDATPLGQTASAGVAMWDLIETADELTARADAALYAAKHAGRGRAIDG